SVVALEPVLLVQGDDGAQVGTPTVEGARVAAVVVGDRRQNRIRVFKYKAKKHYRRTHGHRGQVTELRVQALLAAGEPLPDAPSAAEAAPAVAAPSRPRRTRARAEAAPEPAGAGDAEIAAPPKRARPAAPRKKPPSGDDFTEV